MMCAHAAKFRTTIEQAITGKGEAARALAQDGIFAQLTQLVQQDQPYRVLSKSVDWEECVRQQIIAWNGD